MSLQLNQDVSLPISRIYNTNVDIAREKALKLFCGGSEVIYQQYPTNAVSNSQLVFAIQVPGKRTIMDRRVYVQTNFTVTLTGTAFNLNLNTSGGNYWGPRQYPLTSACNNISIDIQNQRFSYDPSQICHALSWYQNNEFYRRSFNSSGCGMPDQWQGYQTQNGPRNVFSYYQSNELEETRCMYNYLQSYQINGGAIVPSYPDVVLGTQPPAATATSVVFTFQVIEPVMCPPLYGGIEDDPGICGFTNAVIVYNIGNIRRLMSGFPTVLAGTVSNISYNITSASLRTRLYNVGLTYNFPSTACWSIYDIQRYTQTDNVAINPLGNAGPTGSTITSQTIAWNGNPKIIFCYVKITEGQINTKQLTVSGSLLCQGEQFTDTFAVINNISITYDNKIVLATATQDEQYQLAIRNGSMMTQSQHKAYVGSVLSFVPAFDFSLKDGDANNVDGPHQFQITVSYVRANTQQPDYPNAYAAYNYDLVLVPVFEGVMWVNMNDGIFKTLYNAVPKSVALTSPIEYGAFKAYNSLTHIYGCGFFDTLKNVVGQIASISAPILGAISAIPGPVGMIGQIGAPIAAAVKGLTGNAYIRRRARR